MSFKSWKAQNGVASKTESTEKETRVEAPVSFRQWREQHPTASTEPEAPEAPEAPAAPQPSTERSTPAQTGRLRPGWDVSDVATAYQQAIREADSFILAPGLSEIVRTRQSPSAAAQTATDLESRMEQYSATMDNTQRNMGAMTPALQQARAGVDQRQREYAGYEQKLELLYDTIENPNTPNGTRSRAIQEYNALLPYARQAAARLDNEVNTYNSLAGQAQQMEAQYNEALLNYQQALPEYDRISSRGNQDAKAFRLEGDRWSQRAKDLEAEANGTEALHPDFTRMTPEQVGEWQQNYFDLRTQAQEANAKASEYRRQEEAAQRRYQNYQYNQLLAGVEKYQTDPNWDKLSRADRSMLGGKVQYRNGTVDYGQKDIDYSIINGDDELLSAWNGNNSIAMSKSYLTQMTDRERAAYNYLYAAKGKDAANDFLKELEPTLNARQRGADRKMWTEMAQQDPWGTSAFSVLATPAKMISLFGQAIDLVTDGNIDQNAAYNSYSHIPSDIRGAVSEQIEKKWGKVGSFAYQTGMSMADFLFQSAITGEFFGASAGATGLAKLTKPALLIMGSGAAADTVIELRDRGVDSTRAMALGTIAGLAEIITENVSLENLLNPDKLADGVIRYILKNMAAEGSEELGSDVINWAADALYDLISGQDEAEWKYQIRQLQKEGMGVREATQKVTLDMVKQAGLDALGGALSGGLMAGGGAPIQLALNSNVGQAARVAAQATRQDLAERNAPIEAPAQVEAPTPIEAAAKAQTVSPLQAAVDKLTTGEPLTQNDGRRILRDETAMQTLRDAGVLTETVRDDAAGRQTVRQAVEQYVAQQAENRAQEEPQTDITPAEEAPRTEGLRLPTAEETLTPAPERVNLLAQNRTEVNDNGTQTPAPAPEAGTVRNAPAEQSFAERARAAAETERSRAILDRSERRTGLGRFLQNYREIRAQQRADQQFASQKQRAAQLQHQADARDLAYTSAAELGVAGGTEKSTMQVIPQDMLDRDQLAAKQAAARDGVDLQFVLGQGEALDDNGAAYNFRGWISADGKRMIVQADHSKLTWQQILSHEELHRLIKSDPEYRRTVENALLSDKKLQPYLGGIVDRYVAAYHDMQVFDENEIIEEMLADYRAGFDMLDIYHGTAGNVAAKKAAAKDIRAVDKTRDKQTSPESGREQFSRESREWQSYELTDEFVQEVPRDERHTFLRSLATKTSTIQKGKIRSIAITTADHLYLFRADGYMTGTIVDKIDLNAEIERAKNARKEFWDGADKDAEIADIWSETVSNIRGESRGGISVSLQGRGENAGDDKFSSAKFGRDGRPDNGEADGYSEEEINELPEGAIFFDGNDAYRVGENHAVEKLDTTAFNSDIGASDAEIEAEANQEHFSRELDPDTLDRLNSEPTVTVYRAMQVVDGKLYPPMAAKVSEDGGKRQWVEPTEMDTWYRSDEHPELIDASGKFVLDKGNGSSLKAAYNPYFHTSNMMLNDQFSSAWNRDNLVVVEASIPASELTSGYRAEGAKDPVGEMNWHSGPVASKLKGNKARRVTLSRWVKINRIVPNAEVAQSIAKLLDGENISIPENTVTPSLRAELEKLGVPVGKAKGNFSRELDADYLAAVEQGDTETAQRMVDEAAKAAGYTVKAWHQTAKDFTVFSTDNPLAGKNDSETPNGIFFKTNDHDIGLEGKKQMAMAINPGRTLNFKDRKEANAWYRDHVEGYDSLSKRMESALRPIDNELQNIEDKMFADGTTDEEYNRLDKEWNNLLERMHTEEDRYRGQLRNLLDAYFLGESRPYDSIHLGYDGHRYVEGKRENVETYIVFSNKQAKSAAPVTYDDAGKPIPLSERFNPDDEDIRYSREIDPEEAARAETRALQPVSPGSYTGGPRSRGRSTNPRKKVSRVRTHAYELGGLYNEVEAQMAETQPEEFTYDPISEKRSMNEALGRLRKDFDGEAEKLASSDQWGGSDLDTAMGILYQYRQIGRETGDYSLFNEWSHVIQQKGTKGGQFVQAFAKYSRTATGVAQKAAENLRETAGKLNPKQQKLIEGHVSDILGAIDNDTEAAARDAVEKSKGKKGLRLPGGNDTQRARDAENIIKQIHKIFSQQTRRNHGLPVEEWTKATGDQLAGKIASRLKEPGTKTQTTTQTILGDLVTFAQEHALPAQEARQHRTALDRITDYLNNREAYAEAWGEAKQVLRDMYADDAEKLDALESFLNATITYNGDDFDRTMFRAILEASDLLGMDKQDILDLAAVGTTESVINRIADEFVRRVGTDDATLRDTVRRHIESIVREGNVDGRLERMESEASKELDIKIQDLLRESRRTKADAANRIAQYLINDLGISGTDAAIAANHIAGHYMDQLQQRADRVVDRMFADKKAITKKQRDKLLDLIHLGGLTNANVEDAVVDALGLNKVSRAQQRQIMDAMAQFADTLDAIEDNDLEGLRQLIREQAAVRNTKLSSMAEDVLNHETDVEYLRNFATAQLGLIAADYEARSLGEKVSTVQVISHLLNARTAMRNVTSNQIFDLVDSTANNVGLLSDLIMSQITGQRTVGFEKSWASKEKRQGAVKGMGRSILEVALDVAPSDRNKSKYGTGGRRTFSMANSGVVGRILSRAEKIMGYELNTTDEFHKGSVYAETLESLGRFVDAGYMTEEEAAEFAAQEALYRSFQDDTKMGAFLSGLKDVLNVIAGTGKTNGKTIHGLPVHDFGLGDLVVKYTQVPGALIHRAIEFSPAGYAKAIYNIAQLGNAKSRGESTIKQQRNAALALGRATTGSGLITLFTLLAKLGLLRRGDDEKNKDAAALKTSQGLSGTQINLTAISRLLSGESAEPQQGDVLHDIGFLEPLDSLMTIAALINNDPEIKNLNLYEMFRSAETAKKFVGKSLQGIWLALEDTSAMQTLSNIYSTIRYHDEENDLPLYMQIPIEIASSSLSGFVPAPIRQIAQATDTTYRDQYRSQDLLKQTGARVANAIPGLRLQLAPKLTPLGKDKTYQEPWLNALNALVNPGNINIYDTDEVRDELLKVYEETGDGSMLPARNAPYSINIGHESYTLTPDERTEYLRIRGQEETKFVESLLATSWYRNADADTKAAFLNSAKNIANDIAKSQWAAERGITYRDTTYRKYLKMLADGTRYADVIKANNEDLVDTVVLGISRQVWDDTKEAFNDIANSDLSSYDKGVQQRALICDLELNDRQKLVVYGDLANTESREEQFRTVMDTGLSFNETAKIFDKYSEYKSEDETRASQDAKDFALWVDQRQDLTDEQKKVIKEQFKYWQMIPAEAERYEKYVGLGFEPEVASRIDSALSELQPLPGHDSVTNMQRAQAALGALGKNASQSDQMKIVESFYGGSTTNKDGSLSQWGKIKKVTGSGVTVDKTLTMVEDGSLDAYCKWMDSDQKKAGINSDTYIQTVKKYNDTHSEYDKETGKEIKGKTRKDKMISYIDGLNLSVEQKDSLYLMEYKESGLKDTPWHKGGSSGAGKTYAMSGLRLPTPERREPISSGLRLQSAPAARPNSGGLRLK